MNNGAKLRVAVRSLCRIRTSSTEQPKLSILKRPIGSSSNVFRSQVAGQAIKGIGACSSRATESSREKKEASVGPDKNRYHGVTWNGDSEEMRQLENRDICLDRTVVVAGIRRETGVGG